MKYYKYKELLICAFLGAIFLISIVSNLQFLEVWWMWLPVVELSALVYFLFGRNVIYPVSIYPDRVCYRGKQYRWEEIKITAYPTSNRSSRHTYILLFGTHYFYNHNMREVQRKGFYVYANATVVTEILRYYHRKIWIMDWWGNQAPINATAKVNRLIREHNKNHPVVPHGEKYFE